MKTSDLTEQRGFDILIQIVELRILQIRHTLAPFETDTKEHYFSWTYGISLDIDYFTQITQVKTNDVTRTRGFEVSYSNFRTQILVR